MKGKILPGVLKTEGQKERKDRYGLLGETLLHSFSPEIHRELGNDAYGLFPVKREMLSSFLRAADFSGLNVTIPYKQDVIPYLDGISEKAERIGSVNTIVNRRGKLYGYNTDYAGLSYAAKRAGISFSGKKVLILGNGGTSLTARAAAQDGGAREIIVAFRHKKEAMADSWHEASPILEAPSHLERDSICAAVSYEQLSSHRDCEIIINATPVGMFPKNGERLIRLSDFPACSGVIDVIYNPFRTALILDAKKRGIPCTNGLPMLVAQAKYASDLFFGTAADEEEACRGEVPDPKIERIAGLLSERLSNLVLIGMPGAGKSSIGRLLSERLQKSFLDLDQKIEEESGKSIPEIFSAEGEEGFRDRESRAAKEAGKLRSTVIAAGGGTVLRTENMEALQQNACLILIDRALSALSTAGRPLSKDPETLRRMKEEREPLYRAFADITVSNDQTAEACVEEILEKLKQTVIL